MTTQAIWKNLIAISQCPIVYTFFIIVMLVYTSVQAKSVAGEIKLVSAPDITPTEREFVVFGIPFPKGAVTSLAQVKVYDKRSGREIPIHIDPGWTWQADGSLRSARIQMMVDMTRGDRQIGFDLSGRDTNADIHARRPFAAGTFVIRDAKRLFYPIPRIYAIHDWEYVASTGLMAPFLWDPKSSYAAFLNRQADRILEFDWSEAGKDVDRAWQYDRVKAIWLTALVTGRQELYREAHLTYQHWQRHIRTTGRPIQPRWGDWTNPSVCRGGIQFPRTKVEGRKQHERVCDGKFIYLGYLKLYYALTGDDDLWTQEIIRDTASLALHQSWQYATDIPYRRENQGYTERAAGYALQSMVHICELTGATLPCGQVDLRLQLLREHQLNNPDGLKPDGCLRHSWLVHEAGKDAFPGYGVQDDRAFSPWMSALVAQGLWEAYFLLDKPLAAEILVDIARCTQRHGFSDSLYQNADYAGALYDHPQAQRRGPHAWSSLCGQPKTPLPTYVGSSVARASAIVTFQNSDGWFSDLHIPDIMMTLAGGAYFTPDAAERAVFVKRLQTMVGFFTPDCADKVVKTPRMFGWQNSGNGPMTWQWVARQIGVKSE
jgi:hypothetical protein